MTKLFAIQLLDNCMLNLNGSKYVILALMIKILRQRTPAHPYSVHNRNLPANRQIIFEKAIYIFNRQRTVTSSSGCFLQT